MIRWLQVLLMVTALLACPFHCSTVAASDSPAKQSKCSCHRCKCVAAAPDQRGEQAPDDDAEAGDCICRGALVTSDVTRVACEPLAVSPLDVVLEVAGEAPHDLGAAPRLSDWPDPPTGWQVRLAHLSLLI